MLDNTRKPPRSVLAQNIITRRKAMGWSQLILAEKSNLGLNTIKSIERDLSGGWPGTKEAIAKALKCTVNDLNRSEPKVTDSDIQKAITDAVKELFPSEFTKNDLSMIPNEVIQNWNKADSIRQMVCLYLLTRDDRYAQRLGHETVSRLEAIFRMTPHENQRKKKTP